MQIFEKYRSFFLSALSGLMLVLIFPPFELEVLAWGALVPLFSTVQDASPKKLALCGFITGSIFYFFGLHWIINTMVNYGHISILIGYPILGLLSAYLALYISIFCVISCRLSAGRPLYFVLITPFVWTTLEYARSTPLEYGFSWLGLGYSQYKSLAVIQLAEITGVYGVSAMIVWVNAALSFIISAWWSGTGYNKNLSLRIGLITVVMAILYLCFGLHSINKYESANERPIKVSLIQGNISQDVKWNERFRERVIAIYDRLTLQGAKSRPDLIVWPEAATPYYFGISSKETKALKNLIAKARSPLLFGSPYYEQKDSGVTMFNSAYLVDSEGKTKDRYDKVHLVPFGEFVPMQSILFFVKKMVQGIGNFGRGDHQTLFRLGDVPFGTSICYEIIFPDLVRRPVKSGARFLVNITNDAWFGESAASKQHFAMAALRAVENRVPIIRSANTGISGVVDSTGRMREQTGLFKEAVVNTTIVPSSGQLTIYARNGDWFCWFSFGVCIFTIILLRPSRK